MHGSRKRVERTPLLLAFLVWATTLPVLHLCAVQDAAAQAETGTSTVGLTAWEYRWGDSPLDADGTPAWAKENASSTGWEPTPTPLNPDGREGQEHLWLRHLLPSSTWPNPILFVPPIVLSYELFLDGERLLKVGTFGESPLDKVHSTTRHYVPLPPDPGGRMLAIRIYSDVSRYIGPIESFRIGHPTGVVAAVFMDDLDGTVLGVLFTFLGFFSVVLFAFGRGRGQRECLSFGAFTLCMGIGPLALSPMLGWIGLAPTAAYYLGFGSFFFFPVGMFAFLEQTMGEGPWRIMRRVWQFHLAAGIVALALDLLNVALMPVLQRGLLMILAVDIVATVFVGTRESSRGNVEARIINAGGVVLALTGMHDILVGFGFIPEWQYLFHWGTFAFALVLGYVLERTFAENHRQLMVKADELARANDGLTSEIAERLKVEEALRQANREVEGLKDRLEAENTYLQDEIRTEHNFDEIISQSPAFKAVLRNVEQVASTDSTVLVLGETGTGKELLVRAVHGISHRSDRPLVKVNCAALPANLIESELFGHERGAFTGAHARKRGRFEVADGGTIFLDEIGDLPPELQAKLLRVLQEGEFERVGGTDAIRVDVRVIAATNRDLVEAIAQKHFREDLFYRLNVFPIRLPPLRERKEDIPLLVQHFVRKYSAKTGKEIRRIAQHTIDVLSSYAWPGNIRELENVVERGVVISRGDQLDLGDWLPAGDGPSSAAASGEPGRQATLEEVERDHIRAVLEQTGWRVSGAGGAASILGMKRTTLESRMKRLGIERSG